MKVLPPLQKPYPDKAKLIDLMHPKDLTVGKKPLIEAINTAKVTADIRVNLLSLSLLYAFRKPLPEVLKTRVMDPIGASQSWSWHG